MSLKKNSIQIHGYLKFLKHKEFVLRVTVPDMQMLSKGHGGNRISLHSQFRLYGFS